MRNPFGRRVPKPLDDSEIAARAVDYCGIVEVGADFYDPPAFSESTITKQPEFHPVMNRRKDQQKRVA